jgi:hypothetical protein
MGKFTKVAFILKMLNKKTICNMSNKGLLDGETLPCLYRETKRYCQDLSFAYEFIHACQNDYVFF